MTRSWSKRRPSRLLTGKAYTDPQFGLDKQDSHDLAVVVLDSPVPAVTPYSLPSAGVLDAGKLASVVVVGYGADQAATSKKDPSFSFDFTRRWAVASVEQVSKTEVRTSLRTGGACHGDSGGPNLVGSTVVAVTSHGDTECAKRSYAYRVDTPQARAFLSQFTPLP